MINKYVTERQRMIQKNTLSLSLSLSSLSLSLLSLSLSLSFFLSLSLSLSVTLSTSLSFSFTLSPFSVFFSFFPSLRPLAPSRFLSVSFCFSLSLSLSLSLSRSLFPSLLVRAKSKRTYDAQLLRWSAIDQLNILQLWDSDSSSCLSVICVCKLVHPAKK